jgi:hypothetical protein
VPLRFRKGRRLASNAGGILRKVAFLDIAFTGAKTPVIQIKICPFIEGLAAILIFIGTLI